MCPQATLVCETAAKNVYFEIPFIFWYLKRYMETSSFQLQRLGNAFKAMRVNRGLTQAKAGELARIPRLSVIRIEAGRDTVAVGAYDKLASALGAELTLVPRTRPTLEELRDFK